MPAFVDNRSPSDKRRGLMKELAAVGLRYNDRFEFMCRTHGICGPSRLTVRFKSDEQVHIKT